MVVDDHYADFRGILRKEVRRITGAYRPAWSRPIVEVVDALREAGCPAVFFGGALRSLVISRYWQHRAGRPRDIDIVVQGEGIARFQKAFEHLPAKQNRFGGLQMRNRDWLFDIWPVDATWAFRQREIVAPGFSQLPDTTFLNIEAIAMDVWTDPGRPRTIYDGAGLFYDGVVNRLIEINMEDNPYPGLCVARALVFASQSGFGLGPKLARYIALHGPTMAKADMERVQLQHYGAIRIHEGLMRQWIERISRYVEAGSTATINLPRVEQMMLWSESKDRMPRLAIRVLGQGGTG